MKIRCTKGNVLSRIPKGFNFLNSLSLRDHPTITMRIFCSNGPQKSNSSYDVPNTARYQNRNHLNRPQSAGNPLLAPTAPQSNYIDILKSPEELPSNSPPMIKYLEPSRSSPPVDFCVSIPLEQYSDSDATPKGSPAGRDDVYEAMDGSNA